MSCAPLARLSGQEPTADGGLVGVQAVADEVVEVVPLAHLFDRLLGVLAAVVGGWPVVTGRATA